MTAIQKIHPSTAKSDALAILAEQQRNALEKVGEKQTPQHLYSLYAKKLVEAVSEVKEEEAEAYIYNELPMLADFSGLLAKLQEKATPESALASPAMQIMEWRNPENLNRLLFLAFKSFADSLNLTRKPNLYQFTDMVSVVRAEFLDLSVTDVILCLRGAKAGKYGTFYEGLDVMKVSAMLQKYREEKQSQKERQHYENKADAGQNGLIGIMNALPEADRKEMSDMISRIGNEQAKSKIQKRIEEFENEDKDLITDEDAEFVAFQAKVVPFLETMSETDYDMMLLKLEEIKKPVLFAWMQEQKKRRFMARHKDA